MYEISVALSVLISLVLYEGFGLMTGGMISAGYLSLYVDQPLRIVATLILAGMLCGLGRLMSKFTIFYGKRRFFFMVLTGIALAWLTEKYLLIHFPLSQDMRFVGRLIPGLIANDIYRQGALRTVLALALSTVLLRLLVLALGLL